MVRKKIVLPKPAPPQVEVSVRTIYHDGQHLPALCFRHFEPPSAQAIVGDSIEGVKDVSLSIREHDKASPILYHGMAYPPHRFAMHMREYVANGVPISSGARALLKSLVTDLPPVKAELPVHQALHITRTKSLSKPGMLRVSGQDLVRQLAMIANLSAEKVRAKLRAAGLRAPYLDEVACRKALGIKPQ